jgi:preprotein translocase SecE subunit
MGAILVGLVVQAACVSAFAQFAMPDYRVAGLLNRSSVLALFGGGASFVAMIRYKQAIRFTDEVVGELLLVTWPTRDETVRASTTVVLTTLFTAAVLAFYDLIWKNLADIVLFTEG